MSETPREYLTVAQAALRAGVSESLIYEACRTKALTHYRPGVRGRGRILILPEDVDAWMAGFRVRASGAVQGTVAAPLKHIKL